jgi:hypothetical protein
MTNRLNVLLVIAAALACFPAWAQMDLAGTWAQRMHEDAGERGGGPAIGDYTGLPINDAARMRADTWSPSKWTVPEHQCEPHPVDYAPLGPASMLITAEHDPATFDVIAWHITYSWMTPKQTIWMDGRAHPSEYAPRTWMGFSTGHWEGDILVVKVTHLKEGWIRRNGVPRSDIADVTQYWIRHGDILQLITVIDDPVYLTEPSVRSVAWEANPGYRMGPYTCSARVEIERPQGYVPHFLPGTNPLLEDYTEATGVPWQAARGGAETQYPEYLETLEELLGEE